jgi:ribonuclease HII
LSAVGDETPVQFGVDEAGKGPVLGSMFAAAVRAPPAALPDGIDDSKQLADAHREVLAEQLRSDDCVEIGIAEIPPSRIDDGNMNVLTVAAHAAAVAEVARAGDAGHCDAGDVDADRFGERVETRIETSVSIEATHGADESDALVGAASIIAKNERERHVETLRERFGEVGSGYPSDPTTRSFLRSYLEEHGSFPPPTRESWSTCATIRADSEQSEIDSF